MEWLLAASVITNAILAYHLLSTRKLLRYYIVFSGDLTVRIDDMRDIIKGYDDVIRKEREQLHYILLAFMQKEEILALQEQEVWLQHLQEKLKKEIAEKES